MTSVEKAQSALTAAQTARDSAHTRIEKALTDGASPDVVMKLANELAQHEAAVANAQTALNEASRVGRATVQVGERRVSADGKVDAKGGSIIVKDLDECRVSTVQSEFALSLVANSRDVQTAIVEAHASAFASDPPKQLPKEKGRFGTYYSPTAWGGIRIGSPAVALKLLQDAAAAIGYTLPAILQPGAEGQAEYLAVRPAIADEDCVKVGAPSGPR